MVVLIMSHRLDALSRKPGSTSFTSGFPWATLLARSIASPFGRSRRTDILGQAMAASASRSYTTVSDAITSTR